MKILFELSGENERLSRGEVIACLESSGIRYREEGYFGPLLIVDIDSGDLQRACRLSERLAMTHCIYKVIERSSPYENEIMEAVDGMEMKDEIGKDETFAVRVKVRGKIRKSIDRMKLERGIGAKIKKEGREVRLINPDKTVSVLITDDVCVIGLLLRRTDKKHFSERPHKRPFFFPGVILPKFARAIVNLSRIREGEILFDPFCGTGGILIEGAILGARIMGMDIKERMIEGARRNFEFYGLDADTIVGNAMKIPIRDESIDGVVADPPYGRSSFSSASPKVLYNEATREIGRIIKRGKYAVVLFNFPMKEDIGELKLVENYEYYVHKGLTRHIAVFKKI